MSPGEINLLGPLVWQEAPFWGNTTACGRFSIRQQTINGVTDYTLWQRGKSGAVIPKSLGTFKTFQEAADFAEEAKYGEEKRYNKIHDWKSKYAKK
jgi:hypothetical protein